MLCSIPTGKSTSNWLDRLRSSKGFPDGNDLDLEHFLISNSSTDSNVSETDSKLNSDSTRIDEKTKKTDVNVKQDTEICSVGENEENRENQWLGMMSNVLAELFNMRGCDEIRKFRKKSSRKQPNPKIHVVERSLDRVTNNEGVLEIAEGKEKEIGDQMKVKKIGDFDSIAVEDENSNADLSAFSRTEVTIIDTSCASWKFEKLLFRKRNVWKVRDKKSKSRSVIRKKRKMNQYDKKFGLKKKSKLSVPTISSSKEANGEESVVPSKEEHSPKDKTEKAEKEMTADVFNQVPKKRFRFTRSPRKSRNLSVIDVKNIPQSS